MSSTEIASDSIIRIDSLCLRLSDKRALFDSLSLNFDKPEFVVLAGANGSGKTVLTKIIIGLIEADSGSILYHGTSIAKQLPQVRRSVAVVFQEAETQIVGETLYDDTCFGPENLRLSENEIRERATKALMAMNLWEKRDMRPEELSGGERRRLAIAGGLAMDCEMLILDEPFANLDSNCIRGLLASLVSLKQSGKCILVLTHELEKVLAHADRFLVLKDGKIQIDGKPSLILGLDLEQYGLHNPIANYTRLEDLTWIR